MRFITAIPAAEILRHCLALIPGAKADKFDLAFSSLNIEGMDGPELSGPGSLTFLGASASLKLREHVKAALIFAEVGVTGPVGIPLVEVSSIHAAMSELLKAFGEKFLRPAPFSTPNENSLEIKNRIAPNAVVLGFLEDNVEVGAGAFVGKGSYIGAGSRIEVNATILENCHVGRNCILQSGVVIGCAGFGFFPGERGLQAMPHMAGVHIGDDCWIGANTVISAGVLNPTSIGRGCKLDSHVQIAHNVQLGEEGLLASQSGIAGSTSVGARFQMGGAASIDGHLHLGDDVSVAACSGVTKDLPDNSVMAGFPAQPIREWRRQKILLRRLDEDSKKV